MIAVRNQNPDIDLRIIFYKDGKIGNKRKDGTWLKQSDWAVRNKFKFSIGQCPEEWMAE